MKIDDIVRDYEKLVSSRPEGYPPETSRMVHDLAQRVSAFEFPPPCFRAEGVDPDDPLSRLAHSLHGIAWELQRAGRPEDGVLAFRIELALYDTVSGKEDLSLRTLHMLGSTLHQSGRLDEAAHVRSHIAELLPELWRTGRGSSVVRLGKNCGATVIGRTWRDESQDVEWVLSIAATVYQYLAEQNDDFQGEFFRHWADLAELYDKTGSVEKLMEMSEQERSAGSSFSSASPPPRALELLARRYADAGEIGRAVEAQDWAVKRFRALSGNRPAVFQTQLADALEKLSRDLLAQGSTQRAVAAAEETVQLRSSISGLQLLARCLLAAGRTYDAVFVAQVAYENAQRHEPRHSGLLVEESAQVLRDCLRALDLPRAGVQRLREAEAVYLEVHTHFNEVSLALAEIRTRLAATRPGAVAVSAPHEEMIAAGERATAAARERLSSGEGALSTLALHLHNLALAHIDAEHASQAVQVLEESIELYRSLAQHEPFWHSRVVRGQKVLAVLDRMP